MAFNIGLNVIETEGKTAPAIAGAPTSVAGLILRSGRGPTDTAVRVSNLQQFFARFGSYDSRFAGAYCVAGFFGNGGQQAYVARVAGTGNAAASLTLKDRAGNDTVTVTAGYRGTSDPGAWGNDLYVGVKDNPEFSATLAATLAGNQPARLQGTAWAGPTVDLSTAGGTPRKLVLTVDGSATSLTVTFGPGAVPVLAQATAEEVAAAINAQAGRSVVASASAGGLLIVSRTKGAASAVAVVTGAAGDDATRTLLGFPGGDTTAAGAASAAPGYTEAQLTSVAGLAPGDWIRFDDGITADWVRLATAEQRDSPSGPTFFVTFAEPSPDRRNEYRVQDNATASTCEFTLTIARKADTDTAFTALETWDKLTLDATLPNYAALKINDPYSGSASIVLRDLNPASFDGRHVPPPAAAIRLGVPTPDTTALTRTRGSDGADPTVPQYTSALGRFDTLAIQLLAVPEAVPQALLGPITRAALDYAETRGDCMFVGHTPAGRDPDGARTFGQDFRAAKVYGALYWPWITITDPVGSGQTPTRVIPPTGHVLGVYARTDQTRNVWKAPAGDEALVQGALAVERDITDTDNTDLVKNGSVNAIRLIHGAGIVIDSSRTLSTDTRWLYVNVRLLFNYVKASLRDGLRWVRQEPNRDTLWNKIKYNSVTPFLLRLYQAQAFGTGTPAEVFTVVCGPENNPPDQVALGNLKVEVYFYPSRPAETILIMVGQQDSGATAGEA